MKIDLYKLFGIFILIMAFFLIIQALLNTFIYDNSKLPELEQEYCQSIHMDKVTKVIRYHEQSICTDGLNEREIQYNDDIFCEVKYKKLLGWCD